MKTPKKRRDRSARRRHRSRPAPRPAAFAPDADGGFDLPVGDLPALPAGWRYVPADGPLEPLLNPLSPGGHLFLIPAERDDGRRGCVVAFVDPAADGAAD